MILVLLLAIPVLAITCVTSTVVTTPVQTYTTALTMTGTSTIFDTYTTVLVYTTTTVRNNTTYTLTETKYIFETSTTTTVVTFTTTFATAVTNPPTTYFMISCSIRNWTTPTQQAGNPAVGGPWTLLDRISPLLTPIVILSVLTYSIFSGRTELAVGLVVGAVALYALQTALGTNPMANTLLTLMLLGAVLLYLAGRR